MAASLTLNLQPDVIPASDWAEGKENGLHGLDGEPLIETFLQTFHLDEDFRRQGLGGSLQRDALIRAQLLGAYLIRSWSSLDR